MSKKHPLRQGLLVVMAFLSLSGTLTGLLDIFINQTAAAAPPTPSSTYTIDLFRGIGDTEKQTCGATLNKPGPVTSLLSDNVLLGLANDPGSKGLTNDEKQLFKDASDPNRNFVTISLTGAKDCTYYGIVFIQSETDPTLFYGTSTYDGVGSGQLTDQDIAGTPYGARIHTDTKSIDFWWPVGPGAQYNFILQNWDANAFVAGGGAGSTAGAGTCPDNKLSEVGAGNKSASDSQKQLQACVNHFASTAKFINFSTIEFAGATFTSSYWGGDKADDGADAHNDQMRYKLVASPNDPDWLKGSSSGVAYLDLDTSVSYDASSGTHNGADLNIDGDSSIGDFAKNMQAIAGDGGAHMSVKLVDINQNGTYYNGDNGKQIWVSAIGATSLPVVGGYYGPKSTSATPDTITTVFSDGGTEKQFLGTYVKTGTGVYTLASGKCAAASQKPHFTLSDPSAATAGTVLTATWDLVDSSCGDHNTTVKLLVAADTAKSPTPPTTPPAPTTATASCETNGDPLSWIACPIINALAHAADGIYANFINPFLFTKPLDINNSSDKVSQAVYAGWSNFRIIGDIFLVIALLVVVFGESLGGGVIDAYTAKKALPRILVAAILINLSIYIVAVLIDITNIIGTGLVQLITSPFNGVNGGFNLTPNAGAGLGIATAVGAASLWAISGLGALLEVFLTCVLLPGFLILLSIVITILVRRGIIILLVLISPVAFALYCLPNTEQYFKKWWDTLLKTLMVYPIIAALFGLAKVMSVTIRWGGETSSGAGSIASSISDLLSIVALFIPLMLIPFAFRLAGGVLGRVHDLSSSVKDRAHKMGEGRRHRATEHLQHAQIQRRQNTYAALQANASKGGSFRRATLGRGLKALGKGVGGYNIEAAASAARAQVGKELNDQIATGQDMEIRGLTVDKKTSQSRTTADGKLQYMSLGGAWVDEADVDAGHRRWGHSTFAQQTALAYEMRKAQTTEQAQHLVDNYRTVAHGAWHNSEQQLQGSWIGASFEHQNQHLAYKYTDQSASGGGTMTDSKGAGFVDEIYEKRGSYGLAQMDAYTIQQLQHRYDTSSSVEEKQKITAIAETFVHDMGAGGGQLQPTGAEGELQYTPPAGGEGAATAGRGRQASTPGAAHVAELARNLAASTGVLGTAPTGGNPIAPGPVPGNSQKS